jgi:hypothetical protein
MSSASMANTIADEEVIVENKKEVKEDQKVALRAKTDCCTIYDLAYNLAIKEGATTANAEAAANMAYNNCKG